MLISKQMFILKILFFIQICRTITVQTHSMNAIKKNILFVIVDDLRPALGCYNDPLSKTPHIDQLAEKSALFERIYAQALCAPSRNSMLTSRRPDTLHLYDFYSYWRNSVGNFTTMPQYFKENGYNTFSIGKVFHPGISSNFNDDFPFSWSNKSYHPSTERFMNEAVCFDKREQTMQKNIICPVNVKFQPKKTLPDIQSINKAKQILNSHHDDIDKPFFLAVGLHKPHIPLRFPSKYLRYHSIDKFQTNNFNYVPYKLPTVAFNPYTDIRRRDDFKRLNVSFPFGPIQKQFAWHFRQAYYAAVTYIDALIGNLLESVNFLNTIIILTGDHGYSLGEHAEWAKYTNYEIGLRVPLIIYSPDYIYENVHKINALSEMIDIFPTIVDLAALPSLQYCATSPFKQLTCTQGKTLLPYFSKKFNRSNDLNGFAISQCPRPSSYPQADSDRPHLKNIKIMGYSLRFEHYRYTIWLEFDSKKFKRNWCKHFGEELYDHSIDPDEMINLVDRNEFYDLKRILKNKLREKLNG